MEQVCQRCSQVHDRCAGHNRAGSPCRNHPGEGFTVCRMHGGNAPQVQRKAAERVAEAAAAQAVATFGLAVDVSPTDALLEEVHRTAGHVRWLGDQVKELERAALAWGRSKLEIIDASEYPGVNVTETAAVNVWVDLYQRERKHLVDVCKAAIAAGIEERRVRLAEAQGELVGQAIRQILEGLSLTSEQRSRVPDLVRRHLADVS